MPLDIISLSKVVNSIANGTGGVVNISSFARKNDLKTSKLENDSGFITNTVNNLINYYAKNETYSKSEVNSIIRNITGLRMEIITDTANVDKPENKVIYLIESGNYYNQYIYTNDWYMIGSTQLDLSGYVTSEQLTTELINYVKNNELTTILSNYVTSTQLTTELSDKADNDHTHDGLVHSNRTVIDKFSEDSKGNLLYNGKSISSGNSTTTVVTSFTPEHGYISVEEMNAAIESLEFKEGEFSITNGRIWTCKNNQSVDCGKAIDSIQAVEIFNGKASVLGEYEYDVQNIFERFKLIIVYACVYVNGIAGNTVSLPITCLDSAQDVKIIRGGWSNNYFQVAFILNDNSFIINETGSSINVWRDPAICKIVGVY